MQIISKKSMDFKSQRKRLRSIYSITFTALFLALYVALYTLNIAITPVIQFRLGFLVIAVAGLFGGPFMGLIVGAGGDLLAFLIAGGHGASFFIGFTISYAIMGFLFGLLFYGSRINVWRGIAGAMVEFFISIFLNTYWLSMLFGSSFLPLFITRLPKALIMIVISSFLLFVVLKTISMVLIRSNLIQE